MFSAGPGRLPMSRGAQQTTRYLTDQQLAQQNQAIPLESQSDT